MRAVRPASCCQDGHRSPHARPGRAAWCFGRATRSDSPPRRPTSPTRSSRTRARTCCRSCASTAPTRTSYESARGQAWASVQPAEHLHVQHQPVADALPGRAPRVGGARRPERAPGGARGRERAARHDDDAGAARLSPGAVRRAHRRAAGRQPRARVESRRAARAAREGGPGRTLRRAARARRARQPRAGVHPGAQRSRARPARPEAHPQPARRPAARAGQPDRYVGRDGAPHAPLDTTAAPDRATVRSAELNASARRLGVTVARADYWPTLSVFFQSGYSAFPPIGYGVPTLSRCAHGDRLPAGHRRGPALPERRVLLRPADGREHLPARSSTDSASSRTSTSRRHRPASPTCSSSRSARRSRSTSRARAPSCVARARRTPRAGRTRARRTRRSSLRRCASRAA